MKTNAQAPLPSSFFGSRRPRAAEAFDAAAEKKRTVDRAKLFLKNRSRRIVAALAFLSAAVVFYYWQNETISVESYVVENSKIPAAFDGFQIVQVSDLHNKEFGRDNRRLLAKIRAATPDLIAITGDLTNDPNLDLDFAANFVQKAAQIAPTYYVSGNHEVCADAETYYFPLLKTLEQRGAIVLTDDKVEISRGSDKIVVAGIDDPWLAQNRAPRRRPDSEIVAKSLDGLNLSRDEFTVLLAHRPDLIAVYADAGIDLALTGHAHGGQIAIPWIGGIYAPSQGLFPLYSNGVYRRDQTTEIVSRGLGSSVFPTRIFNRPHLVVCKLKTAR